LTKLILAMEMARSQVGVRRIKGRRDRSDEWTKGQVLAPNALKNQDLGQDCRRRTERGGRSGAGADRLKSPFLAPGVSDLGLPSRTREVQVKIMSERQPKIRRATQVPKTSQKKAPNPLIVLETDSTQ
jgi:hypothetical protein